MRPKKYLGQHFLQSNKVLTDIISTAQLSDTDTVIEVGPGRGVLTGRLLEQVGHVIATEKDHDLIEQLQTTFSKEIDTGKLTLIEGDVLSLQPEQYLNDKTPYKLVANIPYYITGAIIEHFLSSSLQPESAVLLIQKEVAERIVAKERKESILSISVKAYGEPRYIQTVPSDVFIPAPKVDSAILRIENISRDFFEKNNVSEKLFFSVVKRGFAHKRKKLTNNLGVVSERLAQCGVSTTSRAENLGVEEWACLASKVTSRQ